MICAKNILNNAGNSFKERLKAHETYQQFMWDNFQTNPSYPRSISFIFPIVVEYKSVDDQNPQFIKFKDKFIYLLEDRLYDLNKRGDCQETTKALLLAYKDTVDPKIIEKLQHLKNTNLTFNAKFLEDMLSMIKKGLL